MNSGFAGTIVHRFPIVIGFLILSVPSLYRFLSQPRQRKTDCCRTGSPAPCLHSPAQWLTCKPGAWIKFHSSGTKQTGRSATFCPRLFPLWKAPNYDLALQTNEIIVLFSCFCTVVKTLKHDSLITDTYCSSFYACRARKCLSLGAQQELWDMPFWLDM